MSTPTTLDPLGFAFRDSRLIEASAGTGKTFTLALLYTRLVLGHGDEHTAFERGLMPPEILVVTFTEAATQELRERIRSRLVEAATWFEADPPQVSAADPVSAANPLHRLRSDYPPERWTGCARTLRLAAEWMDEAMISTIHGWCQRMLQEHAFETRGLFQREVITDQTDLINEILRDYWRVHFYPLPAAEAHCVRQAITSPEHLHDQLRPWLRQRDAGLSFQGHPLRCPDLRPALDKALEHQARQDRVDALEQAARDQWRADRQAIESHLWTLQPHLNGTRHGSSQPEKFTIMLKDIQAWSEGESAPNRLGNFAQGAFHFKAKAPVQEEMPHPAFTAIAQWQQAAGELKPADGHTEPTLEACILAHASEWVGRELTRRLRQQAQMGFDDLLREMDIALTPGSDDTAADPARHLAATLRRQFPVALIDEFQDTDPIQYRIFDRVYGAAATQDAREPTALVMIGDPKQAIYGFRGADIHSYLAAREATRGRHHTLATNYRSTQGMVEACNRLFTHAEGHPRGAFRFRPETGSEAENPIPYQPVSAHGRSETLILEGDPHPAMTFWLFDPGDGPVAPDTYREAMAAAAASRIVQWLEAARRGEAGFRHGDGKDGEWKPLRPRDIAILVRTGTEAAVMRQALAARQIHSVYLSDRNSVFRTREARDLLHWLRACACPTDEGLVRAALGTNTLDLPLETLAGWQEDELAWEEQLERFHGYQRTWQRQGVLAMLRRLMHDQALPRQLLEQEEGERVLTNLLHLAEWLQQAARGLDGEQALIRHLSEHLDADDEEFLVRLESDAELIQVVTIHKSKGLEYPLVLLPFICSWREVNGRTAQVPLRRDDARYIETAGRNQYREAWDEADDDRLSEDMRLLYVAITRARHGVWLGIAPLKSGNTRKIQLEKSAMGHVLNGGQAFDGTEALKQALETLGQDMPHIQVEPAPAPADTPLSPPPRPALDPARPAPDFRHEPWWIASYSGLRVGPLGDEAPEPAPAAETADDELGREEGLDSEPEWPFHARLARSPSGQPTTALSGLHGLPRGRQVGNFLHGIMEWAAAEVRAEGPAGPVQGFAAAAHDRDARHDMLARRCQLRGLTDWIEPLEGWLANYLTTPWTLHSAPGSSPTTLTLADLAPGSLQVEMEFWFAATRVNTRDLDRLAQAHCLPGRRRPGLDPARLNGMLKGFIDLVFEHQGRYYVLDWKSNWLGPDDQSYSTAAMEDAILHHRYDLQYLIYLLALHRQLSLRLPDYDYDRHMGGAIYAFLRGAGGPTRGIHAHRPPRALIEALDALFMGQHPTRMGDLA
ncbi:exodeoxyribonuclease V subunit beta [Ectothiorhodospira variabilis]|uniref:exodeoxyribonuclease V subunit beta n=1 Tax=Ectothiorhodospira variabilis TaxID=505694 RepID=UPI001EFBFAA6|nr:exodeoxyribonuclease V subunit beta [Ectothiorhodospira variabilis]MCG5494074.1 exodeoxyribonuclease V subunit beta [Ectothiorhodospira variabilis]MCG5503396.1 exodeoxyribonuclease V subunit beta [Ectothiorhodospira variabilis]MCG5506516.1 exodeoxyribonuclease V subunit beta [Ectothiorhodospira variabilis]